MNKKLYLLFGILMLMLIPFISAAVNWDNSMKYKNNEMKVDFKNTIIIIPNVIPREYTQSTAYRN